MREGRPVILRGYVQGPRCLMSVTSAVDAVTNAYRAEMLVVKKDGTPALDKKGREQFHADPGNLMWRTRIRETLAAVVPELTPDEADVIANTYGDAIEVLTELNWFSRGEVEDDPEATGEAAPGSPSSGDDSSPATPSTTATTRDA